MNRWLGTGVVAVMVTLGAGCASTLEGAGGASGAGRLEHRTLAQGVVLTVSDDASPEARQIAEEFQSEMRSRYINAR